jgi:hypothetical protein
MTLITGMLLNVSLSVYYCALTGSLSVCVLLCSDWFSECLLNCALAGSLSVCVLMCSGWFSE